MDDPIAGPVMTDPILALDWSIADHVSIAFHQNAVPVIQEITLRNLGDTPLEDLTVELSTEPGFTAPTVWRIDRLDPGASHHLPTPDLKLDAGLFTRLSEGIRADVTLAVRAGETELARQDRQVRLLPPSHWGGAGSSPELLAAFVRPNDPAIDTILRDAAARLAASGRDGTLDGYERGQKAHVWAIAESIWAALAARALQYVLPPTSFERTGQKVRSPSDIVERGVGTCLDLSLTLAAALAQAGLAPIVVLVEGHAFVGLWLKPLELPATVTDDVQLLRKRRDLDDLLLIETTFLTSQPPGRFSAAVRQGAAQIEDGAQRSFELAIDVRRAWAQHIRPLDLGDGAAGPATAPDGAPFVLDPEPPPSFAEEIAAGPGRDDPASRLDTWKRRLLDLSLRNRLLNFQPTRNTVLIDCPAPAELEDGLADGTRFRLLPRSELLSGADLRSARLIAERQHDDVRASFLRAAMGKGELHTLSAPAELDAQLTELFRAARAAMEEGGANLLFLALGFLRWTRDPATAPAKAPILLVPVQLERASVRAGFRLGRLDEEARINPTLLQMLRQDFDLRIPALEGELPTDAAGLDIARIWRLVREAILPLAGWEVVPELALSTFSFTKFLMWKDLVDRTELLKRSPVVRHLIDTPKRTYGDGSGLPEPRSIDRDYHPSQLFTPLMADSSQLAAVVAAASGRDFVLVGPPGTGKSQTIANMIAQCLATGRTVLFVSQKTAALEVVQRRLSEIGLADYCLEVHSTKAQKSQVLAQLRRAWHERALPDETGWRAGTDELAELQAELNRLTTALHRRHPNGLSAFDALGRVVAAGDRHAELRLDWPDSPDAEALARMRSVCRDLRTAIQSVGDPTTHPLAALHLVEWSPAWRNEITQVIDGLLRDLPALDLAAAELAAGLGLERSIHPPALEARMQLARALLRPEASGGAALLGPGASSILAAIEELRGLLAKIAEQERGLEARYAPSIYYDDLHRIQEEWRLAAASFWFPARRARPIREQVAVHAYGPVPEDLAAELERLIAIGGLRARVARLGSVLAPLGTAWQGPDTAPDAFDDLQRWATQVERLAARVAPEAPAELLAKLMAALDPARLDAAARGFEAAWRRASDGIDRFAGLAALDPAVAGEDWIDALLALAADIRTHLPRARDWAFWQATLQRAHAEQLGPLADALASGRLAPDEVEAALDTVHARWWADRVVTEDACLRGFMVSRHEDAIQRFRALDERVRLLSRSIVRARLAGDVPAPSAFGDDPQWGTLAREMTRKARHMPLRQLFARIPDVLTCLTPCVMMSPLSIAQYLPADASPFDVVIFDEASQMAVWDAIGAIARGRQVVVVGDPEQLPPTSVGERDGADPDDGAEIADQESILDECIACNLPTHRLDWHYRSRHESLIAFSNHHYYQGRLVTFPSPVTTDRAVRHVEVPGGVYERGAGRINRQEAQAVTAEIVRRLTDPSFVASRRSLGVVTFNAEQQRLIENLLDQERRQRPEIEPYFSAATWHEPVFVKNLENVQGDERDVIIFSVAVAPDQTGRVVATISSLNLEGGHRRLNVAITRARRELVVFSTLRPEQIDLSRTRARGVRDFKHFLEYAERGPRAMAETFAPTGRGTDSPFEDAVMAALEAKGWEVHPQVGASGFRIDLGIVHPDQPGRYLAGVECDGATYHRSATVRDRDRLREMVLTGLGWRIFRVWSLDWWHDAGTALDRLQAQLDEALADDRATRAAECTNEPETVPTLPPADDPEPTEPPNVQHYAGLPGPIAPGYRIAVPAESAQPRPERFYDLDYRPMLAAMATHVIQAEAPVFADIVAIRLARAHGFQRTGDRIRSAVMAAIDRRFPTQMEDERIVLWPIGALPGTIVPFRPSRGLRDAADIPLVELAGLARQCLDEVGPADAVRRMADRLELARLPLATRQRLEAALQLALDERVEPA